MPLFLLISHIVKVKQGVARMNRLNRSVSARHLLASLIVMFLPVVLFLEQAVAFSLSVTNQGTGSGNINGAVSCNIDPLGQCSAALPGGAVTLTANADWKAIFTGWGAPCSGIGSCDFTLLADTDLPVTFTPNFQAIIVGHDMAPKYATLADAYAAAKDQNNIAANVYTFHEDLVLNAPIFVRLFFGRAPGEYYSAAIGFTTIMGSLTVQNGAVEIDSLIIR